jgi:hypothetical protein
MATLAAPPPAKSPAKKASPRDPRWSDRLAHSGYLLGAILLHLLVFLIVATWVVFQPPKPPADDFVKTYVPAGEPPPPPPPPSQPTMPVPSAVSNPTTAITTVNPTAPAFNVPLPTINPTTTVTSVKMNQPPPTMPNNLDKRIEAIKNTETQHWGRSTSNIAEAGGDPHNVVARFPVYLASYADGDWGCNVHLAKGQIDAGSLPDLVAKINEWSHGNLKGDVVPTPLAIGGPDLIAKMPPFIFFTGHKDFILTDTEIENLRQYLQNGGCIWGDNALAGSGSRFDVAFRREMKRVIPDADKNFEKYSVTSDLFKKGWNNLDKVPEGMNFYAEPIEHIDIDGKLAVLYTPNDYSDLMFMRILPGDTDYSTDRPTPDDPLFTSGLFLYHNGVFFRNFTLDGCLGAQRFGMNVIGFLLVRFDKELILAP